MIKMILNNKEVRILNFNRNTSVNNGEVFSSAFASLGTDAETVSTIHALVKEPAITSLVIKNNDEIIYDAGTIDATITSINETLNTTEISLTLNIDFH